MSLACEISGEPLLDKTDNEVVVTPSGHICIKRLLLTKLLETGGMDPFETSRPLSEDQLVTLQLGNSSGSATSLPRPQATALPNMLSLIQKEYDALVLELFDTRKALEETRRELSQALYQNDAAIRVVARVSQERDTLQQQLEQWNASAAATPAAAAATSESATAEAPSAKRRKLSDQVLENDIPEEDLAIMSEKWAELNKARKPTLKAAAAEAPSAESLGSTVFLETKAWHKSTNRGISCIDSDGDLTVTTGKDKQVVVYNEENKVVQQTFALGAVASCVSIGSGLVVAGTAKGAITLYTLGGDDAKGSTIDVGSGIVAVCVHPTGQHVCAATQDGRVVVAVAQDSQLTQVSSFSDKSNDGYTAAALHPDGLIYVAGTKSGKLHAWDFKNKTLAATLQEGEDAVSALAISNNGYYIATGYASANLRFWDLRKQKVVASLEKPLDSISTVAFDKSGKYAAFGGAGGVKITTIKEWGTTASLDTKKPVSGIVWSSKSSNCVLEVSSDGERSVQLFGIPSSSEAKAE